jgi:cytochrome P450
MAADAVGVTATAPSDMSGDDVLDPGLDPVAIAATLFSIETANDPRPVYGQLRRHCPVAQTPGYSGEGSSWILSRYDDVMWALRHPEVFSSAPEAVDIGQAHTLIPLQIDPPEHAKYRRWLDPEFSPKRIADIERDARELVGHLVDQFAARGSCDFHEEFATPLPSTIFLRLMGWPQSDLPLFLQWRDNTVRPDVAPDDWDGAQRIREQTGKEINEYFVAAIEEKRKRPDDALLSRLVFGEVEGRPLTDEELLGTCHLLMIAGLDTVTATLDCMISYLARHPDRRRMITERPELVDNAVEELLRHETPVMMVARVVKQDWEYGGMAMKAGDSLTPLIGAANHDDDEFDDPHEVDFDRTGNRHLAFGAGPHRCLGSHLARMELRVAIDEFHKRIPDYRLAEGCELVYSPGIRQTNDGCPLEWDV